MITDLQTTIKLAGASGQEYTLHLFQFEDFNDLKGFFDPVGGIYVFLRWEIFKRDFRLVYCGKTDNLHTRYNNHHAETCIRNSFARHYAVVQVDDKSDRTAIEEDLLAQYDFSCNVQLN